MTGAMLPKMVVNSCPAMTHACHFQKKGRNLQWKASQLLSQVRSPVQVWAIRNRGVLRSRQIKVGKTVGHMLVRKDHRRFRREELNASLVMDNKDDSLKLPQIEKDPNLQETLAKDWQAKDDPVRAQPVEP